MTPVPIHHLYLSVGGKLEVHGPTGNTLWNFGWYPDHQRIQQFLGTLPKPRFQDAAPECMETADRKADQNALLWEACKIITGGNLPAKKQRIGCCVSMGWSSGVDYLQCVDIATRHKAQEYKPVSHAVFYGLARERGHMLGGGDGCYGAAAAEAAQKDGCVSNDEAKDSGTDDTLASQYGSRGVPANLKELARKHLCGPPALVKSAEECKAALLNGYPVPVCSDQGFSMQRDQDGYCRAEGSWSHCVLPDTWIAGPVFRQAKDVQVGDQVYGHDGKAHPVLKVYTRPFHGNLACLKASGLPTVEVTEEHPVLIYRRARRMHGSHRHAKLAAGISVVPVNLESHHVDSRRFEPAWVMAKDVRPGDYLASPELQKQEVVVPRWITDREDQKDPHCGGARCRPLPPLQASENLAWFFGFYIGDGTAHRGHKIGLTLSLKDPLDRVLRALEELGVTGEVQRHPTFIRVTAYSAILADSFAEWFGTSSADKHIPEWLLSWNVQAVVAGLLQADGCEYKGRCIITSVSEVLAHQVRLLLVQSGQRPALYRKPAGAPGQFANAQEQFTVEWRPGSRYQTVRRTKDLVLHKVRSVLLRPYDGEVFNYEVEDVHSYLADGVVVHNCMVIIAYRGDKRRFCILQSWGQNTPSGPTSLGQPDNSFWVDWDVIERMLRQQDSFAVPSFDGYPARDLDWLI